VATRNLQFFSGREELLQILSRIVEALSLVVLARDESGVDWVARVEGSAGLQEFARSPVNRIYLADSGSMVAATTAGPLSPARQGLLLVDLPRIKDGIMLAGQVAVKTDWIDESTGKVRTSADLLKFFNTVASKLRKELRTPMVAENIKTGKSASYSDIGYTESARSFVESGGELMQEGVLNIRFRIPESSSPGSGRA
jgi:hypothetical protein